MCDLAGLLAASLLALVLFGMSLGVVLFELLARRWREQEPKRYTVARPAKRRRRKEQA